MGQDSLVSEEIEAGLKFIEAFHKIHPVKTAFWLKPADDGGWSLYLASDEIDDTNFDRAYGEVLHVVEGLRDPHLDPFQIKLLIHRNDALVQSVLDFHKRYPGVHGTHHRGTMLGGRSIDGAYFYPLLSPVPSS
jgi:hypothetical protein